MWKRVVLLWILILAAGSPPLFGQRALTQSSRREATKKRTDLNRPIVKEKVGLDKLTWLVGDWGSNGDRAVATRATGGHYISDLAIVRDKGDRLLVTYIYTTRRGSGSVRHDAIRHSAKWDEKQLQFHVETRRIEAVPDDGHLTFDAEELQRQPAQKHIIAIGKETGGDNWWRWSIWIKRPDGREFARFYPLPTVRGERDESLNWEELYLKFPTPSRVAHWPYDTITPHSGFGPILFGRPR